jgi:CHAT domain-containing protein
MLQDQSRSAAGGLSLAEVRRRLPQNTVLVEYWLGNDSLVALWATANKSGVHLTPDSSGLRQRLKEFNLALADVSTQAWREKARSIGKELLDGLGTVLSSPAATNIIVVPDREVSLIPFEVLPLQDGSAKRVVDRYAVSYLPSASLLHLAAGARAVFPFWRRTILALADPAPRPSAGSFTMPSARAARRLPAAEDEVRTIGAITGGKTSTYTGSQATREHLMRGLQSGFPILHFATHAFTDPEDPARSYILLAGATAAQAYDYLFLNEIRSLNLRGVDLVTLSACETERGKLVEGEGAASFSRALLGSGARAVVTSLWQVGDRPGAEFMEAFYSGLASGSSASESLRLAKVRLAARRYHHPFYWAAFVLNGEPGVTAPFVPGWPFIAGTLLGFAGVSTLLWSRLRRTR